MSYQGEMMPLLPAPPTLLMLPARIPLRPGDEITLRNSRKARVQCIMRDGLVRVLEEHTLDFLVPNYFTLQELEDMRGLAA